jgi:hypothetical protein
MMMLNCLNYIALDVGIPASGEDILIQTEAVVTCFQLLLWPFPGLMTRWLVSWAKFEPRT